MYVTYNNYIMKLLLALSNTKVHGWYNITCGYFYYFVVSILSVNVLVKISH